MTIECSQGEHSIVSKAFRFWELLHDCRSVAALQRWWFRCLSFLQPGQSLREGLQSPIPAQDQAGTAEGSAAGLVYTEEGLKDTLLIFLRNSPSRIGNKDQKLFGLLGDADLYRTVWTIVFDRILCQIEDHTIDQCVAAGHNTVTCKLQSDAGFFRPAA